MKVQDEKLGDDLLFGAAEIAHFTGLSVRQIYHQQKNLRLTRLGSMLIGSKKKLRNLLASEAA